MSLLNYQLPLCTNGTRLITGSLKSRTQESEVWRMYRDFSDGGGGGSRMLTGRRSHMSKDSYHVIGKELDLPYTTLLMNQLHTHYMLNIYMKAEIKDICKHLSESATI